MNTSFLPAGYRIVQVVLDMVEYIQYRRDFSFLTAHSPQSMLVMQCHLQRQRIHGFPGSAANHDPTSRDASIGGSVSRVWITSCGGAFACASHINNVGDR